MLEECWKSRAGAKTERSDPAAVCLRMIGLRPKLRPTSTKEASGWLVDLPALVKTRIAEQATFQPLFSLLLTFLSQQSLFCRAAWGRCLACSLDD